MKKTQSSGMTNKDYQSAYYTENSDSIKQYNLEYGRKNKESLKLKRQEKTKK